MRTRLLHSVRDPGGDGRRVRRVPGAGVLLKGGRSGVEWWRSYFDASYLAEYQPLFRAEGDRREVARLVELLGLPAGSRLLDCPCGQGRHAHLLAEAGYDVTGVDYSRELLARARRRGTGKGLRYRRADMRELPRDWSGSFSAVLNLFTSFGFFSDAADDRRVLAEFARVLEPGGALIWHGGNRDGVMARFLRRDWWRLDDGTIVAQERSFDPLSGFLSVSSESSGKSAFPPREHRIRLYTATRIAEMCADVGLVVTEAFDGWSERPLTRTSGEMLLVARKESSRRLPRTRRSR
jgi:ubiquinone/menaquinone biosynthesis C-methylase UbiE